MGFTEVKAYLDTEGYGDRVTEFTVSLSLIHISEPTRH